MYHRFIKNYTFILIGIIISLLFVWFLCGPNLKQESKDYITTESFAKEWGSTLLIEKFPYLEDCEFEVGYDEKRQIWHVNRVQEDGTGGYEWVLFRSTGEVVEYGGLA